MKNIVLFLLISSLAFSQNIYTFAGTGYIGNTGDGGPAILAQIGNPHGICIDNLGNVYFTSSQLIRKVDQSGIITTVAGSTATAFGFSGDGGPALGAEFNGPCGIAIDVSGNLYINDGGNARIRKINTSGIITTIAGTGTVGYSGDGGPATSAQICVYYGIAVDASGNIYFSDPCSHRIRKINSSGIISTFAGVGTAGFSGDGAAANLAQINNPVGLTIDGAGNIYFSDLANFRIRKITSSGIISTIAGNGTVGTSGDGGPATAAQLFAYYLALDLSGNMFFTGTDRIRKISSNGIISTVVGTTTPGYSGDGGPALSAQIATPYGIAVDANSNYYFGQTSSGPWPLCIRVVCQNACLLGIEENERQNSIKIFPNPVKDVLKFKFDGIATNIKEIQMINSIGKIVMKSSYTENIDISYLFPGFYLVKIETDGQHYFGKFLKE